MSGTYSVNLIAVLGLFVGTYLALALWFPVAYIWATYEDLFGEWTQAYFFLAAAILLAVNASRTTQYRWFSLLLVFSCLYGFLEEISWGQRLIGFDSPDVFKEHNL